MAWLRSILRKQSKLARHLEADLGSHRRSFLGVRELLSTLIASFLSAALEGAYRTSNSLSLAVRSTSSMVLPVGVVSPPLSPRHSAFAVKVVLVMAGCADVAARRLCHFRPRHARTPSFVARIKKLCTKVESFIREFSHHPSTQRHTSIHCCSRHPLHKVSAADKLCLG